MKQWIKIKIIVFFVMYIWVLPMIAQAKDYGKINCLKTEVHENADMNSKIVGCVIGEMRFEIVDKQQDEYGNNWLYIKPDNGIEGYILAEKVEMIFFSDNNSAKINMVRCRNKVNVRQECSKDAEIIESVPRNQELQVLRVAIDEAGDTWYQIEYNGVTGYISAGAVEVTEEAETEENHDETEMREENLEVNIVENQIESVETEMTLAEEKNEKKSEIEPVHSEEKIFVVKEANKTPQDVKYKSKGIPIEVFLIFGIVIGMSLCVLLIRKMRKLMK